MERIKNIGWIMIIVAGIIMLFSVIKAEWARDDRDNLDRIERSIGEISETLKEISHTMKDISRTLEEMSRD